MSDIYTDSTRSIWIPVNKSKLIINGSFHIYFTQNKPNLWWRMWQYLLMGFKWEDET